jgi:hypothetical protein
MFIKYEVKDTDLFFAERYPNAISELAIAATHLKEVPGMHKADMFISFLKSHSIKTEWLKNNQPVSKLITSGFLQTHHIEALFNGSRHNKKFTEELEAWMKLQLSNE